MDTDGAGAELGAVEDDVVGEGADGALVVDQRAGLDVFLVRRGEGMVRGVPGLRLLVPLVHGEVGDPEEFEVGGGLGLLEEPVLVGELLCELEAESADALVDPLRIVVPHRGRAELGSDDDDEVFGGVGGPLKSDISAAELAFDGLGERDEGRGWCGGGRRRGSRGRSRRRRRGSRRPGLAALVPESSPTLGDGEAEDGQRRVDLERVAEFGGELVRRDRPWRAAACRACRCRSCWMAWS